MKNQLFLKVKKADIDENSDPGVTVLEIDVNHVDSADDNNVDCSMLSVSNGGEKYFQLSEVSESNTIRIEVAQEAMDFEYLKEKNRWH